MNEVVKKGLKVSKKELVCKPPKCRVAKKVEFTLQDVLDAVKYGFDYRDISQHQGFVPKGNILQWLMYKKNLVDVPKDWVE